MGLGFRICGFRVQGLGRGVVHKEAAKKLESDARGTGLGLRSCHLSQSKLLVSLI